MEQNNFNISWLKIVWNTYCSLQEFHENVQNKTKLTKLFVRKKKKIHAFTYILRWWDYSVGIKIKQFSIKLFILSFDSIKLYLRPVVSQRDVINVTSQWKEKHIIKLKELCQNQIISNEQSFWEWLITFISLLRTRAGFSWAILFNTGYWHFMALIIHSFDFGSNCTWEEYPYWIKEGHEEGTSHKHTQSNNKLLITCH